MSTVARFLGHPGWCIFIYAGHAWDGCSCARCGRVPDVHHDPVGCRCSRCGAALHEWGAWEALRTSFYDLEQRKCVREGCPAIETSVAPD